MDKIARINEAKIRAIQVSLMSCIAYPQNSDIRGRDEGHTGNSPILQDIKNNRSETLVEESHRFFVVLLLLSAIIRITILLAILAVLQRIFGFSSSHFGIYQPTVRASRRRMEVRMRFLEGGMMRNLVNPIYSALSVGRL